MKSVIVLCVLLFQMTPLLQSSFLSRQRRNDREWRPGTHLGLTAGTSTRVDVLRVLGEPTRLDTPSDQTPNDPNPEVWYVYDRGGEFTGVLTVILDKRKDTVLRIDLTPDALTKDEAVKHFGADYIFTRYAFDDCLGDEESAPVYESATGPLLKIEYRNRGIAISVGNDGKVNTISYVSKPIGPSESRCNRAGQAKPHHGCRL